MGTVLVVDDQPLNRVVISKLLRSLNLDVVEACDGQQGLQKYLQFGRSAIAFVFLDLMMPVLDGFDAALSIRSVESRYGWLPVPIVAFTSEDVRHGSPTWHQCMRSGFNDVVPKPIKKQHTLQLLFRWLPGLKDRQNSGSLSNRSSGIEMVCSCLEHGCSKCSQGSSSGPATGNSSLQAQRGCTCEVCQSN